MRLCFGPLTLLRCSCRPLIRLFGRMLVSENGQMATENEITVSRGALIVLEGCDRSGKSTHSKLLCEYLLNDRGLRAELLKFPNRTTPTGRLIDEYLKAENELSDEAIHLLFSANRWEVAGEMRQKLLRGVNLVVDRYAFSGVSYTSAKGISLLWCMAPDRGLPSPDAVLFFDVDPQTAAARGGYGDERYENIEFQKRVRSAFHSLRDDATWTVIDANDHETIEQRQRKIRLIADSVIASLSGSVGRLWTSADNEK